MLRAKKVGERLLAKGTFAISIESIRRSLAIQMQGYEEEVG